MKVEFEFTVDEYTGEPKITFKHHDKCSALEQKLLKVFVNRAKERGIALTHTSGFVNIGTSDSWEKYEIVLTPVNI